MAFHTILKESLKRTSLKRVRIKTDPSKVENNEDFKNIEGYEGYILSECAGRIKILVLTPDMPIVDVPPEAFEYIYQNHQQDVFEEFKQYCINYLTEKGTKQNDPLFFNLENAKDFMEIETFLKQHGINEVTLNSIYRDFINYE